MWGVDSSNIMINLTINKHIIGERLKNESPRCFLSRKRWWLWCVSTRTYQEHKTLRVPQLVSQFLSLLRYVLVRFSFIFHAISKRQQLCAKSWTHIYLTHTCTHRAPMSCPVTPQLSHYTSQYTSRWIYHLSSISEFEFWLVTGSAEHQ
jgi:hypothetical protein